MCGARSSPSKSYVSGSMTASSSTSTSLPTTEAAAARGHIGLVVLGAIAFGLLLGLLFVVVSSLAGQSTR